MNLFEERARAKHRAALTRIDSAALLAVNLEEARHELRLRDAQRAKAEEAYRAQEDADYQAGRTGEER